MSVLFKSDVVNLLQKNDAKDKMEFVSPNILPVAWEWQRRMYLGSCIPRLSRSLSLVRVMTGVRLWWRRVAGGILLSLQKFTPSVLLLACEQALLFGWVKRVSRQRASERRSREGPAKGELATIPYKFSFVLRPDEGKYHWLKNDVPEIKVDW